MSVPQKIAAVLMNASKWLCLGSRVIVINASSLARTAFPMTGRGRRSEFLLAGLLALIVAGAASAHELHGSAPTAPGSFTPIAMTVPDVDVVDQNGRKLKFYRDLVEGRTVAINFVFTTCRTICPMLTATFSAVQNALGDRLGRDLFLISISLDPENDSAFELNAYAQNFGAKPGWTFVTGEPANITRLLKALNANAADKDDHTAIALIGNGTDNTWQRAYGLDSSQMIAATLQRAALAYPRRQGPHRTSRICR